MNKDVEDYNKVSVVFYELSNVDMDPLKFLHDEEGKPRLLPNEKICRRMEGVRAYMIKQKTKSSIRGKYFF